MTSMNRTHDVKLVVGLIPTLPIWTSMHAGHDCRIEAS